MVFASSKDFILTRKWVFPLELGQFTVPNKNYEKMVRVILNLLTQTIDPTCWATCKGWVAIKGMNEIKE